MGNVSSELLLIIMALVVVVSYVFSIISNYLKVPSVLLLLLAGIILREVSMKQNWQVNVPQQITEFFGVIGLIMIVLEAGLDLKLGRSKIKVIRSSFFSALFILLLSMAGVSATLHYWLNMPVINCLVYSVPLSIMSSSIVLPSLHHLSAVKREFLVYEASFSDILGILIFNYFTAGQILSMAGASSFILNLILAIVLSIIFSALLFLILAKSQMNVKFFLVFALLIILYEGGKTFGLPTLLIILTFGLLMNNWNLFKIKKLNRFFAKEKVDEAGHLLHSITAESSFLIRTFFFILFGYSIDLRMIASLNVILLGSAIVIILLIMRYLYLRFFLKERVYPEVFFIPRGLVTILLFYKIPIAFQPANFEGGVLFFVILVTSIIMMFGTIFYKKKEDVIVEEELLPN